MEKLNGYEPYRESEFKNHIAELEESVKAWEKIYTYVAKLEAKNAALEKKIETLKAESIKHSLDFASEYAAIAKRVSELEVALRATQDAYFGLYTAACKFEDRADRAEETARVLAAEVEEATRRVAELEEDNNILCGE